MTPAMERPRTEYMASMYLSCWPATFDEAISGPRPLIHGTHPLSTFDPSSAHAVESTLVDMFARQSRPALRQKNIVIPPSLPLLIIGSGTLSAVSGRSNGQPRHPAPVSFASSASRGQPLSRPSPDPLQVLPPAHRSHHPQSNRFPHRGGSMAGGLMYLGRPRSGT